MVLNKRSKLEQLFAESCGAEDPVCFFSNDIKPISVFHARINAENVFKEVILTEFFDFLLQNWALRFIVDRINGSNLISNSEELKGWKSADFVKDWVQVFVSGWDELVSIKATLLKDTVENFSFVLILSCTVEESITSQEICIDLVCTVAFLLVLESCRAEKFDKNTVWVLEVFPCWWA